MAGVELAIMMNIAILVRRKLNLAKKVMMESVNQNVLHVEKSSKKVQKMRVKKSECLWTLGR